MLRATAFCFLILSAGCATDAKSTAASAPGQSVSVAAAPGSMALHVKGMGCPLCATNVRKSLERVPAVEAVKIDLGAGVVKVSARANTTLEETAVRKAVADAGFELAQVDRL